MIMMYHINNSDDIDDDDDDVDDDVDDADIQMI